jgi:hypothetical protein
MAIINGCFCDNETEHNGRPVFTHGTSYVFWSGTVWAMAESVTDTTSQWLYYSDEDVETPYNLGNQWYVGTLGTANAGYVDIDCPSSSSSSSQSPVLWAPDDSADALAWWDASDYSTITESSNLVTNWADKIASNDATGAGGSEPTYSSGADSIAGGSTKYLTLPTDIFTGESEGDVVFVGTQVSAGGGWGRYSTNSSNTHTPWSGGPTYYDGWLSTIRAAASTTSTVVVGTQILQSRHQTGTQIQFWESGIQIGANVNATFVDTPTAGLATFFKCQTNYTLNEVVFLSSDTDRQTAEGYLAWKWDGINGDTALVTALPGGHPYKSAAPTV